MNSYYITKMLRIFIIYIVIQTAASALTKKQRYDQILANIHDIFKLKSYDKTISRSTNDYNGLNSVNDNDKADRQRLKEILADITNTLDKIKADLLKFGEDGIVTIEVPAGNTVNRRKREISNETLTNVTVIKINEPENNVTVTENPETITEKPVTVTVNNETVDAKPVLRVNNETDSNVSGRRMIPDYVTTNSRVKDKLLSYLEDTFNEVERKIQPLTNIKIALSNDDHYRTGYIIATIDTLEVNLKKLKNDMNLHQHIWNDEKILDLFDRIKATNSVTSTLIETLKKYLPKN